MLRRLSESQMSDKASPLILIFSNSRDEATNNVLPWLDRLGANWLRINDDEPAGVSVELQLGPDDIRFRVDGSWYNSTDIAAIWYRKGGFWLTPPPVPPEFEGRPALNHLLKKKMERENGAAARYFHELMRRLGVRTLGNALLGDPNKLVVLAEAALVGLKTPAFEVTNRLSDRHLANPSAFITKSISDGVYLWDREQELRGYFSYTEDLSLVLQEDTGCTDIPLSLIQEKVDKSFEIRSFFMDGLFLSTAIYSQEDPQTLIDYRKYNRERPNRMVPMVLPHEVSAKLVALFQRLDLNTGSVDLIVDANGEFVFLEINPFGVYGAMADICNFNIDKAIAYWLCGRQDHDHNHSCDNVRGTTEPVAARL